VTERSRTSDFAVEAAIGLALAGTAWLLYHPILRLWWMHDDFYHLRHLITGRPWWYFFDVAEYRQLSKVFTPLLFLELDLDRRWCGLRPACFYLDQLIVLCLCPAVLYGVLRLWLPRLWAAVGAGIFLLGPVTGSLAPLLMVRHYLAAILLAALAVGAWAGALRRTGTGAWTLAWLSAALYFAASLAKEIAVPLPLLLLFTPGSAGVPPASFSKEGRLRLLLPHALAFVLYLLLRTAALGALLGGYGFVATPADLPALPGKIAAQLAGSRLSLAAVLFMIALAAGIVSLLLTGGRRAALLTGLALLLAMLPVLPVSTQMEPRFAVPAWIAVAVAFAAGCRLMAERWRWAGIGLALVAVLAGLALNRQDWRVRFAQAERMSAENRSLFEMKDGDVLRHPVMLAASLGELQWMKVNVFHRPAAGRWFQDDLYLCIHREPLGRVWGYDDDARRIVDLTARIDGLRTRSCSSIRPAVPLRASFHVMGEKIFWDLGPYRQGNYEFVLGDGTVALPMPRHAGFQIQGFTPLSLRVKYESPAGWTTYSPDLRLELADGWTLRWRR
jgi:hypothetical protein